VSSLPLILARSSTRRSIATCFSLTSRTPFLGPPAFPTRRSADLDPSRAVSRDPEGSAEGVRAPLRVAANQMTIQRPRNHLIRCRSEEHTSELQSRRDIVCRLLLVKKKPVDYVEDEVKLLEAPLSA